MSEHKSKREELAEALRRKARELDEKLHLKERLEERAKAAQEAAKESLRNAQQAAQDSAKVAQEALREGATLSDAVKQGARQAQDSVKESAKAAQESMRESAKAAQETVKETVRRAQDAAQIVAPIVAENLAGTAANVAEKVRDKVENLDDENMRERARTATDKVRAAAAGASAKANAAFAQAQRIYGKAGRAYDVGAGVKRATGAAVEGARHAAEWAQANPLRAGMVTASVVLGLPLGFAFPRLDAILFGSHPLWFTHSALPVYGLRKAGEKFDSYLQAQERLMADGKLDEAEANRVKFERDIVKYVGAPLLGAFSCAAGVAMWAQIFQPGRLVWAPFDWLIGGSPVFDGIWLFGNGVLCFHQGYKFFMIALADQDEVQRVVREIKGLLPESVAQAV